MNNKFLLTFYSEIINQSGFAWFSTKEDLMDFLKYEPVQILDCIEILDCVDIKKEIKNS